MIYNANVWYISNTAGSQKSALVKTFWLIFRPYSAGNVFESSFARFGSLLAHFGTILVIARTMFDHFWYFHKKNLHIFITSQNIFEILPKHLWSITKAYNKWYMYIYIDVGGQYWHHKPPGCSINMGLRWVQKEYNYEFTIFF